MSKLQPYPSYKPSGIDWLGDIPSHWEARRFKNCMQGMNSRKSSEEFELLSLSKSKGLIPQSSLSDKPFPTDDLSMYRVVRPGQVVMNRMQAWNGLFAIASYSGIVSPDYAVFGINPGREQRHLLRVLQHPLWVEEFASLSTGVGSGFNRLYNDRFLSVADLVPPLDEQRAIADYLDRKDAEITRFIDSRRRMIALLEKKKQAIINQAVTRGLDPNVPMKPSGVEWLGEIPAHWEVRPLKRVVRNLNTKRVPLSSSERGQMTQRNYDYYGASGVIDKVEDFIFDGEFILLAEDGANLISRNLPLAIIASGRFWVNNHAHILQPVEGLLEYWAFLLEQIDYAPWISGAAQPKLTQERLMSIVVPFPPLSEQEMILDRIDQRIGEDRLLGRRYLRDVDLMEEYRTRLISDVVTGKVRVN